MTTDPTRDVTDAMIEAGQRAFYASYEGTSIEDVDRKHLTAIYLAMRAADTRTTASPADVEAIARKAMFGIEVARTGVTNPVNGSAPYSWVTFQGQRVEFHDGEFTQPRTAGTEHAAAYAQKINDALFDLAKHAAIAALSTPPAPADHIAGAGKMIAAEPELTSEEEAELVERINGNFYLQPNPAEPVNALVEALEDARGHLASANVLIAALSGRPSIAVETGLERADAALAAYRSAPTGGEGV